MILERIPPSFLKSYSDFYNKNFDKLYQNKKPLLHRDVNPDVLYTEIFLRKNSDSLFLNIGESWTYGESLPGIKTVHSEFNLTSLMTLSFGARISEMMGCDWYQYAVPGNNNLFMFTELDRILEFVRTIGYKKIYLAINITENTRELNYFKTELFNKHPINGLYKTKNIDIKDWVKRYDEIWLDHLENSLNKFQDCSISAIVWKNFTRWCTDKIDRNFKCIELAWPAFSARLEKVNLEMPAISNFPRMDNFLKKRDSNIINDFEWFEKELDLQEKVAKFISKSIYHNNHPNEYGHLAWAIHLVKEAGWVKF